MLEYYGDVIAMRHFQQGAPREAARWASVPVINLAVFLRRDEEIHHEILSTVLDATLNLPFDAVRVRVDEGEVTRSSSWSPASRAWWRSGAT
jgi:hypothetical protein